MAKPPPVSLGKPSAIFKLNPELTMYVYPYDIADVINNDFGLWSPTLTYGGGFNAPEQFEGTTSRWMIQGGQLEVRVGVESRISLTTTAFSNQQSRVLELVGASGRIFGKETIPTNAVPVKFGPFAIPPGTTKLTLIASPGPQVLGATDRRSASVFLEHVSLSTSLAFANGQPVRAGSPVRRR
jgi:hypothetical protein